MSSALSMFSHSALRECDSRLLWLGPSVECKIWRETGMASVVGQSCEFSWGWPCIKMLMTYAKVGLR